LLRELSQIGVTLSKHGHEIVLDGPETVLTDALVERLRAVKSEILRDLQAWNSAEWQAFYNERAGIAEFDGHASRLEAESRAYECCIVEWLNRNPETTVPGQCVQCRQADRSDHVVVPFGTENHAWLHPECWPAWQEVRRRRAASELLNMGIAQPSLALRVAGAGVRVAPETLKSN
jgi:hypothetical protein